MLTNDDISALLSRLDGETADAIESEFLECKEWNPAERRGSEKRLRETVVCFANQGGGVILLGVADRKCTRAEALAGVPKDLDMVSLRKVIYDGTEPHIQVQIEELVEPEGRLLVIRVPVPARRPVTTSEGLGQIRVGKECRPLTGPQIEDLLRPAAAPDQALARRQKTFSLAVGLLRATAGEMFPTSDGATSALPGCPLVREEA